MSVWSREEHAAEPVQFGTPPARFSSFDECFCLIDCFQGFAGAIRQMQSFHLSDQDKWQRDNQAACPTLVNFLLDQRDTFGCVSGGAMDSYKSWLGKGPELSVLRIG